MYPNSEEDFISVYIANSTYNLLFEKYLFDFGDVCAGNFVKVRGCKSSWIIDFRP
jgi:hypothetical protein